MTIPFVRTCARAILEWFIELLEAIEGDGPPPGGAAPVGAA